MEARLHEEGGDAPLIVCVHLTLKLAFPLSFSSTSAPANDSARDAISAGLLGGYSSSSSGSMDSIFIPAMHGMHASHVSNSASGSGSGSANESVAVGAPWGAVRPLAAVRTASMPHHSVPQHAADTHSLANDPCGGVVPVPPCTLLAIMRARRASSSAVYSTYNMSPEAGASLVVGDSAQRRRRASLAGPCAVSEGVRNYRTGNVARFHYTMPRQTCTLLAPGFTCHTLY